jgi:putative transposase
VAYPLRGLQRVGRSSLRMPKRLKRFVGQGDLHFITFCCYQRRPLLASAHARNLAVQVLRELRARYSFALIGYVIMPEHVHLLIGESPSTLPAKLIQIFKQRVSRRFRARPRRNERQLSFGFAAPVSGLRRFWQRRYYDFNVFSRAKVVEKLHYMHANPVRGKLVKHPGDWPWSSWCFYYRSEGLLAVDPWTGPGLGACRDTEARKSRPPFATPKPQRVGHPRRF